MDTWLFGYGSLIWRPDFPFLDQRVARIEGWARRFWQGSHDHRGQPHAPGRVVTLIPSPGESCEGMAFRIADSVMRETFQQLDHREKNGFERHGVQMIFRDGEQVDGVVYIAAQNNFAYLGPAPMADMVEQIRTSKGPSGANTEYLLELASALRCHRIDDPHVFELEAQLLQSVPT